MKQWTPEQIERLKLYWRSQKETTDRYLNNIDAIENTMRMDLDIPELEFFWSDGYIQGIGNMYAEDEDKYELLQLEDLDEE